MSLDLTEVASQVEGMVSRIKAGAMERQEHLRHALDTMAKTDLDSLRRKIAASKTTWLVAGLVDGLSRRCKAPPLPEEFTVIATDGSHIDVDRHRQTRCYLINIGSAVLCYGDQPDAILSSSPRLYSGDQDMVITPPAGGREQPIEGTLLGIKRSVEECRELARLAAELPPQSTALALLDGSLILWGLAGQAYPEFVTGALLTDGFLVHLDAIRKLNTDRQAAVASYISFPRSTDVVNALRVAVCPRESVDSDRYCRECDSRECETLSSVQDRELFSSLLGEGERSALFTSESSVVTRNYGASRVYFFYLRADDEIARVEVPEWVATNDSLLGLAHALILDQCRRGQGYPAALAEAHEQAVVTGADREQFWQLVESSLIVEHLPTLDSAKSRSKRARWI